MSSEKQKEPNEMAFISPKPLAALILIAAALPVAQASTDTVTVSKAEYGEKWPLTVDQVELACEPPTLITVTANGVTYALNGSARTHAKRYGWEDFESIWRTDPTSDPNGTQWKIPASNLIDRGMQLCKK
jgi:hypothetical protein